MMKRKDKIAKLEQQIAEWLTSNSFCFEKEENLQITITVIKFKVTNSKFLRDVTLEIYDMRGKITAHYHLDATDIETTDFGKAFPQRMYAFSLGDPLPSKFFANVEKYRKAFDNAFARQSELKTLKSLVEMHGFEAHIYGSSLTIRPLLQRWASENLLVIRHDDLKGGTAIADIKAIYERFLDLLNDLEFRYLTLNEVDNEYR